MARKRRKRNSAVPIIVFLTLMLVAMVGAFLYLFLFSNTLMIRGEWTRQIDMTAHVRHEIENYLDTANMGDEIDLDQYMTEMIVDCRMVLDADGVYAQRIDTDSYYACCEAASQVLKLAIGDLINKRMAAVKISSDKDVAAMVQDAAGMDIDSYLKKFGPQLMPDLADMQGENDESGSYTADRSMIYINNADGNPVGLESGNLYLVSNSTLVINYGDNTYIYTKERVR